MTTRQYATLDSDGLLDPTQIPSSLGHTHVWNATPTGTINGSNATFTLAAPPSPAGSLLLFKNGMLQRAGSGNDFTLSSSTVTFEAGNVPATGDVLLASYTT